MFSVYEHLLVEAAVERTPANLHQTLRGDQNLVCPFTCTEHTHISQTHTYTECTAFTAVMGFTFVDARGGSDGAEVAVTDDLKYSEVRRRNGGRQR